MTKPNDKTIEQMATEFERREFTEAEVAATKRTRRRAPRLGESRAQVYSFRAPPSYKDRIRRRAADDKKTESEVIREALDAYLG